MKGKVQFVVVETGESFRTGPWSRVHGSWSEMEKAEKFRRQLLARNVDLYPHRQRPYVQVAPVTPAHLPIEAKY